MDRLAMTETAIKVICARCGHEWRPRKDGVVPLSCPKCKRYDWQDEPKKEQ